MGVVIHPPLQFYAGDTWKITWDCKAPDGTALDLTNVISIQWKLDTPSRQNQLTCDLTNSIAVLLPPTAGQCALTLPPSTSADIPPGYYLDQLRVTTADGFVSTQASGRVQCLPPL